MSVLLALAEILFIGDGRIERTVPQLLEAALNRMGGSVTVAVDFIDGAPLQYNLDTPTQPDRSTSPPKVEALSLLQQGETRAVVMTEGMPLDKIVKWHEPVDTITTFAAIARAANPDVRVFLTEGWPNIDSGKVVNSDDPDSGVPWRERIDSERDIWRAIVQKANDDPLAGRITVIPVAQAMGRLDDEMRAGRVPGLTGIGDLFEDPQTPNGRGAYFIAMVEVASMTGKSPEGLPARLLRALPSRDWSISEEQAAIFQRIAWTEVQAYQALPPLTIAEPVVAPTTVAAADPAAQPDVAEIPPAPVPDVIDLPRIENQSLFLGLNGVNDWSAELPFLDVMKTSRSWSGQLPGQFGGWDVADLTAAGALDADGWPTLVPEGLENVFTLVLTDLPADGLGYRGRYVLRHDGKATVTIGGGGKQVSSEPGRVLFDFEPGPGPVVVALTDIDRADPIRNITIVREDRVAAFDAGAIFNPDWLARIRGVKGVRFMDWMATNNSSQSRFDERPKPSDATWTVKGVPVEIMIALSNELDADPWFTLPHLADDDYARQFATMVRDGLEKDRRAWVEYSNEVWNWQFQQAGWAEEQGLKRWGEKSSWVQFYALRASEIAAIWTNVFGAEADARLVRVISTQTGWKGLEPLILESPLVMAEGKPAPAESFDAYAITGYFSGRLGQEDKLPEVRNWISESTGVAEAAAAEKGLTGDEAAAYVAAHRFDAAIPVAAEDLRDGSLTRDAEDSLVDNIDNVFPYQADVARAHGLKLVMYEGGTHVVGIGPAVDDPLLAEFFVALNYSPEMGALYADLLKGWAAVSDQPFNQFVDVTNPTKWGSWGAMRHLGDTSPRWEALRTGCGAC